MKRFVHLGTRVVFGICTGFILFLIVFFQSVDYYTKKHFLLPNAAILAIIFAIFCVGALLYYLYCRKGKCVSLHIPRVSVDRGVFAATVALFFVQCYVCYNIFFLSGWDVSAVRGASESIAYGTDGGFGWEWYFSVYPNNLTLVYISAAILRLNDAFGIFFGEYATMSLVVVNCLLNSLACYLTYKTAAVFVRKRYAALGFILAVWLFGLSPWSVIFYSDSVGIVIPVLALYLYVRPVAGKRRRYICRGASLALLVFGFYIKPQCAIMLIAIIIVEVLYAFSGFEIRKLIKPVSMLLCVAVCFFVVGLTIDLTTNSIGIELEEENALGVTHFLMMGLNRETDGVYCAEDVEFSKSYPTASERNRANLEVSLERLSNMGAAGYIEHVAKKMLVVFNDGTFGWNVEGSFYLDVPESPNSTMSEALKEVYYSDGDMHDAFHLSGQFVWVLIFAFSFLSCLVSRHASHGKLFCILWLTVVGIVMFHILFEVRSRYIYVVLPIFCLLAVWGIGQTVESLKAALRSVANKENKIISCDSGER